MTRLNLEAYVALQKQLEKSIAACGLWVSDKVEDRQTELAASVFSPLSNNSSSTAMQIRDYYERLYSSSKNLLSLLAEDATGLDSEFLIKTFIEKLPRCRPYLPYNKASKASKAVACKNVRQCPNCFARAAEAHQTRLLRFKKKQCRVYQYRVVSDSEKESKNELQKLNRRLLQTTKPIVCSLSKRFNAYSDQLEVSLCIHGGSAKPPIKHNDPCWELVGGSTKSVVKYARAEFTDILKWHKSMVPYTREEFEDYTKKCAVQVPLKHFILRGSAVS